MGARMRESPCVRKSSDRGHDRGMGKRLYVGNLSFDSTEDSVRAAFAADDRTVVEVQIVTDRNSGRPRGFGFVEMGSDAEAQTAIEALNGHDLDGRDINVSEARERPAGSGGGGGGGGGGDRW